jgi:hypothetical protein
LYIVGDQRTATTASKTNPSYSESKISLLKNCDVLLIVGDRHARTTTTASKTNPSYMQGGKQDQPATYAFSAGIYLQ